jgi:hypothetical protein
VKCALVNSGRRKKPNAHCRESSHLASRMRTAEAMFASTRARPCSYIDHAAWRTLRISWLASLMI